MTTQRLLAVLGVGLVDPDTPVLHADDLGLTRGDGCFEGCRVRTTEDGVSTVDKLDAHLARMGRSAAALGIPYDPQPWRELVELARAAWTRPGEAALKLVLTRGRPGADCDTGLLMLDPIPAEYARHRRDGVGVVLLNRGTASTAFADAPWLLGGVKTLSYAVNMAAAREAARRGADDVIFLSADGLVLESPTSSVVWSSAATLHTTPTGPSGILPGTTQQLLFERAERSGWATEVRSATTADLHSADSLWLIGSVRGPVDVVSLEGTPRPRDLDRTAEIRGLCGFG